MDLKFLEPFLEGHLAIPVSEPVENPYVVQENGYIYLKKTYKQETKILEELKRLVKNQVPQFVCEKELPLSEAQSKAVEMALRAPFFILTGGPGTGKTYTAGYILRSLLPLSFVLTAPTGKACAQLKKSIQQSCHDMELPPHRVMTLHALLNQDLPMIPEELVMVDEASMIDLDLMGVLLSKVRPGARLILLGDPNQLPPVETPSLFPDMVELGDRLGFHVGLKECLRIEERQIIDYARDLLEGKVTFPLRPLSEFRIEEQEVILTPLKKGPYGVDHLNKVLFERELGKPRCVVPIIITKNDFQRGFCNGESGVITFEKKDWGGSLRATKGVAKVSDREMPIYELPPFDLGFAISVHKSQGSAYTSPVLLLPQGSAHFGKEMVYTAFTRAKRGITVFGDLSELQTLLSKSSRRLSAIKFRW